jgi:hypothetical protein
MAETDLEALIPIACALPLPFVTPAGGVLIGKEGRIQLFGHLQAQAGGWSGRWSEEAIASVGLGSRSKVVRVRDGSASVRRSRQVAQCPARMLSTAERLSGEQRTVATLQLNGLGRAQHHRSVSGDRKTASHAMCPAQKARMAGIGRQQLREGYKAAGWRMQRNGANSEGTRILRRRNAHRDHLPPQPPHSFLDAP